MNNSVGVDIEEIKRFENKSERFLNRIYTEKELEYCLSKKSPQSHLAVRFCAKEAVIKALSNFGLKIANYKSIEISHDSNHCPIVTLINQTKNKFEFNLSLSHDRTKAIAFVQATKIK